MAHAQKPDFVFRRNGQVHLNRRGTSVQSTTGSRGVRISGSNAGYTMFRGSVKGTGYPLHSPFSPSLPLPFVTVCHHISTGVCQGTRILCTRKCECFTWRRMTATLQPPRIPSTRLRVVPLKHVSFCTVVIALRHGRCSKTAGAAASWCH